MFLIKNKSNNIYFSIAMLIAVIINLMLIAGFSRCIYPIYGYFVFLMFIIFIFLILKNKKIKIKEFYNSLSKFEKVLFWAMILFFISSFIQAFAPITGTDTLADRVNMPKRYIQHHGFIDLPYIISSNWPTATEMLYMLGMLILPDVSANIIAFLISLLLMLTIYGFSKEFFNKKIAFLSVILIISTQTFYSQSYNPLQDMMLAFFSLVSLWSLLEFLKYRNIKFLILFSIFCGTTICVKMTGIIFIFILLIILFIDLIKTKKIYLMFIPVITALIIYSPWAYKAYIFTGNPFYPNLNNYFQLKYPYICFHHSLSESMGPYHLNFLSLFYFIYYFFHITFQPISKYILPLYNQKFVYLTFLNPLIIPLFFVAVIKKYWKTNIFIKFSVIILFVYTVHFVMLINFGGPIPRYVFIIFILLSIIGSWGFYKLSNKYLKQTIKIFIIIWVMFFTLYTTYKKVQTYPKVFGFWTEEEFHEKSQYGFKWYKDFYFLDDIMKNGEKVLLFKPQAYYLDHNYVTSRELMQIINYEGIATPENLHNWLVKKNVKYIWICEETHKWQEKFLVLVKTTIKKYDIKQIYNNSKQNSKIFKL